MADFLVAPTFKCHLEHYCCISIVIVPQSYQIMGVHNGEVFMSLKLCGEEEGPHREAIALHNDFIKSRSWYKANAVHPWLYKSSIS